MVEIKRCDWAENSELERNYHDHEWGRPVHDEHKLFKMLILEGQQAGLSWQTILSKMDAMTEAYDNFNPEILSDYDEHKSEELLSDQRVIRNRLKIKAVIKNAKAHPHVQRMRVGKRTTSHQGGDHGYPGLLHQGGEFLERLRLDDAPADVEDGSPRLRDQFRGRPDLADVRFDGWFVAGQVQFLRPVERGLPDGGF